jgi:DNA topoisomerase-1
VRVGRYGPYVEGEHEGNPVKKSLPDDLAPGDVSREVLKKVIEEGVGGEEPIAVHPETNLPIFVKRGPYGAYVQMGENDQDGEKPKRVSLPKGLEPSGVTPEIAIELLRLPRNLGDHPETGKKIEANIGRFGPYVKHGSTFASLTKDDDVLSVGLDRAVELIRKKENKNAPLKVLGVYPGTEEEVDVREGRYGPYVKYGKVNVSLPKELTPESVTLEDALKLLEEKVASTPAKKSASKKAPAKKTSKAKAAKPKAKAKTKPKASL